MTHNLPAALSSFVGRSGELAAAAELLASTRLVTLVGAAGVGKTRLALRVAAEVKGGPDGVWLAELAPVTSPSLVVTAVATALGIHEQPARSMLDALACHLRGHRLLLVLDNCEHVIGGAAELSEALLGACLDLRILATSREPLGVAGEAILPVPPLPVPPAQDGNRLAAYDSVQLFVERATATDPSFALTPATIPAVAEICRRLDGMPLAIELAAARTSVLSAHEIAARLDDRFRLLTTGSRTAAARHQSLQAALEWSYELLSAREQGLFARLSVFAGSFTLEAAEEVCPADGLPRDEIFHLLAGLVAKSLVVADTSGSSARYRILETIRHYAADVLAASIQGQTSSERHAAYYTRVAEAVEPGLTGPDQCRWIEWLQGEHANFRTALGWSLGHGHAEQALRLAAALALFWTVRGHLSEGRTWLERALAEHADAAPSLRAKTLWALSYVVASNDDYATAVAFARESLALYQATGDVRGMGRALQLVGAFTLINDPGKGRPLLDQSLMLARQTDDRWCLTGSLSLSGLMDACRGDLLVARPRLEEAISLARAANDNPNLVLGLIGLGTVALGEGCYGSAETLLRESLEIARALDSLRWASLALILLGERHRLQGDLTRAQALLGEGLTLGLEGGSPWTASVALSYLGRIAITQGDLDTASRLLSEGLSLARKVAAVSTARVLLVTSELAQVYEGADAAWARIDEALAVARASRADHFVAQALHRRGQLARLEGDLAEAETCLHESLRLWDLVGQRVCLAAALEALGGLAAEQSRSEHAARLLGAAYAFREAIGSVLPPADQAARDADVATARRDLPAEAFAVAWKQGLGLSLEEAVAHAARGRGPRKRPATGWASLTGAEREVARLAAEGLTNAEIGQRLFVSPRTVKAHLGHIFTKLDVTSRRQLDAATRTQRSPVRTPA